MARNKGLVVVAQVAVRWADMDMMGHVNNVLYIRYMEQGRLGWFNAANMPVATDADGPVVASNHCNYRKPIEQMTTVDVKVWCDRAGRSSFRMRYEITDALRPGEFYADGETMLVWVERKTGRPAPVPDALRALISSEEPESGR